MQAHWISNVLILPTEYMIVINAQARPEWLSSHVKYSNVTSIFLHFEIFSFTVHKVVNRSINSKQCTHFNKFKIN